MLTMGLKANLDRNEIKIDAAVRLLDARVGEVLERDADVESLEGQPGAEVRAELKRRGKLIRLIVDGLRQKMRSDAGLDITERSLPAPYRRDACVVAPRASAEVGKAPRLQRRAAGTGATTRVARRRSARGDSSAAPRRCPANPPHARSTGRTPTPPRRQAARQARAQGPPTVSWRRRFRPTDVRTVAARYAGISAVTALALGRT